MKIGFTYDLKSEYLQQGLSLEDAAEFDRDDTIESIEKVLCSLGHTVVRIGNLKSLVKQLSEGKRWELVFNICEGLHGTSREAQVPALLDAYKIPYTFSDAAALVYTLDKALTKRIVRDAGIRTPDFMVIHTREESAQCTLTYPLFVKPLCEGTSKGISKLSKVDNEQTLHEVSAMLLEKYNQPVLVEEFLPGKEFTVGIIGTGCDARVAGVMEIVVNNASDSEIYSFENKKDYEQFIRYKAATDPESSMCAATALAAWRALHLRDGGRVDIRFDRYNEPSFIEVNPLPGLNPIHSDLPILCRLNGVPFEEVIKGILTSAIQRLK